MMADQADGTVNMKAACGGIVVVKVDTLMIRSVKATTFSVQAKLSAVITV